MYNILIVDDEKIERDGIRYLIEKSEYPLKILEASDGKGALDIIETNNVDILFTDIIIPFIDGIELSSKARKLNSNIITIVYSVYGEFEYAKKAIDAKVHKYILKSINEEDFYKVIEEAITLCDEIERQRHFSLIEVMTRSDEPNKNQHSSFIINRALQVIERDYMDNIGLDYIAEQINISPSYLSTLFRKETGLNITKYINQYKLEKAKELITDTNLNITDISEKLGYSSSSYFIMLFKSFFGITPGEYCERVRSMGIFNLK